MQEELYMMLGRIDATTKTTEKEVAELKRVVETKLAAHDAKLAEHEAMIDQMRGAARLAKTLWLVSGGSAAGCVAALVALVRK